MVEGRRAQKAHSKPSVPNESAHGARFSVYRKRSHGLRGVRLRVSRGQSGRTIPTPSVTGTQGYLGRGARPRKGSGLSTAVHLDMSVVCGATCGPLRERIGDDPCVVYRLLQGSRSRGTIGAKEGPVTANDKTGLGSGSGEWQAPRLRQSRFVRRGPITMAIRIAVAK